jgi:heme-degrading monooxygenase HmoA
MFEAQPGFCGALLTATGSRCAVITIWRDAAAAAALDDSTSYRATVAEIERAGFLVGEQSLEVLEITGVAGISLSAVG